MRILVLEHEPDAPAGLLAEWARRRDHTLEVLAAPELERWPEPAQAEAIVSLGSERSVHSSQEPWIEQELAFLRSAHEQQVPILGICFGGQALAAALGGTVTRASELYVDWGTVEVADGGPITRGPWLRWHEDVFTVPPGAREVARSGELPLAFAAGSSVGVQFHPEADAPIAHGWVAASRQRLSERAGELAQLLEQLERDERGARERAGELFDRIERHWRDGA